MEALRAGELWMDLGGLIGDGVRRIDWRARLDIVFSGGGMDCGRRGGGGGDGGYRLGT